MVNSLTPISFGSLGGHAMSEGCRVKEAPTGPALLPAPGQACHSRTVAIPVHAGRDIAKGTLRNILAIIGLDAEELRKLL
jgi:hypothetical protein